MSVLDICSYYLKHNLKTFLEYLKLGHIIGSMNLKKEAIDFIVKNNKTLRETENWDYFGEEKAFLALAVMEAVVDQKL